MRTGSTGAAQARAKRRKPRGQRRAHRAQAVRRRSSTEDAHRQQQIAQPAQRRQEIVGDDAHVAPHLPHQVQQRQRIQRPGRMVGDDQQPPMRRNPRPVRIAGLVPRPQVAHRHGDEVEAAHMPVGGEEGIDLVQPRPARDAAQQRPGQRGAAAAEPVRETLLQALFELDHRDGSPP